MLWSQRLRTTFPGSHRISQNRLRSLARPQPKSGSGPAGEPFCAKFMDSMKRTGQKLRIVSGPVASRRRPRRGNPRSGGAPRRPVKATVKEVLPERVDASASTPGEDILSVDSGSPPSNGTEARASTTPVYQPIDQEEAAASTHEETAASQHTIASSPAPPAVTEPAAPVQHVFPAWPARSRPPVQRPRPSRRSASFS